MIDITIRNAVFDDSEGIATVHVKTWQFAYKNQIPDQYLDSLSIAKRTKTWKKQLEAPEEGTHTLIAEANNQIIGWCTVGKNRDQDALKIPVNY